ncbi:MAG: MarR family transcriptional regulator [Oscillospiraceae bacterium]|nr:MarR family transcriptional regulator [Oscillospiraceae bacterium]MBQ3951905.1 MarR family transcriptional regulator [Oscillospiraceae bacterium]MBQ3987004.1 MarR family transcriptional regulator [Oscillospiraceae bacterium]
MTRQENSILKLENQICFPLYAASRDVIKRYKPYLDDMGLTFTQYITMIVLWEEKTVTVKELGKRLYLDSGTLTPLLKKMEAKGLITRKRSFEDERNLIVTVTEEGERLKEMADGVPEKILVGSEISLEEAVTLRALLLKILK